MAVYVTKWRSNAFEVKNMDAFLEAVEDIPMQIEPALDGRGFLLMDDGDGEYSPLANNTYRDGNDVEIAVDWADIFREHLADGQVAVFMGVGVERMRYLSGMAAAYNQRGETMELDIERIYEMAHAAWGTAPTRCEYDGETAWCPPCGKPKSAKANIERLARLAACDPRLSGLVDYLRTNADDVAEALDGGVSRG